MLEAIQEWIETAQQESHNRRVASALDAAFERAQGQPPSGTSAPVRVLEALDAALSQAPATPAPAVARIDLEHDRYIIFSDHHKGARNGADDFQRAERAYNAALAYYHRLGYTLISLGDVEELWEERAAPVLRAYQHSLALEARFNKDGRYIRFWGNHDDDWRYPDKVSRYLEPIFGPLAVREGLILEIDYQGKALGSLFLVHGHQGDSTSDQFSQVSRFFVRYLWRPLQRLTGISVNTPATDWDLRQRHNIALHRWAEGRNQEPLPEGQPGKLVLIAGHTHQPVFISRIVAEQLGRQMARAEREIAAANDPNERERITRESGEIRARLEWIQALEYQRRQVPSRYRPRTPCYFNTGCCCFTDGDITGIELSEGMIRLIRWPDAQGEPRPKVLQEAYLADVFARC